MSDQDKTREELINELNELRQKNISLKAFYENDIAKFRSYFELPHVGIAITSPEKGWIEANQGIRDMLGYTMEELSGLTWAELTHPDDLAADVEQFNRLLSDQLDTYFLEKRFIRKNGEIIWTSLSVSCVRKPDRSVDYIVALLLNITERKQIEKELRRSENALKNEQQITHVGSFYIDVATNQVTWTDELYKMYGFDPALPPPLFNESQKLFTPESWELLSSSIANTLETGVTYEIELRTLIHDGSSGWMWARGEAIKDTEGKITGILGVVQDITDRKKAEQELRIILAKYQVLFETLPIGITITDASGKIIESNQVAETLLGISREEQEKLKISGKEWRIIRPDGTTMPASEFASVQALEQGRPVTNVEMGIVKGIDQVTWINVSATPVPIEGYGVAIVYSDISSRKQAENENERTQKLLEDSQRIGKVGAWEFNIDTKELKWTREMYNIHEVDLTFKPMVDQRVNFYTPESLPFIDNAIKLAIEQGEPFDIDSEIITAKGNRRTIKSIGKADLAHRRVFGLFQDITERKLAEHALKESELKYRNLFEKAQIGMFRTLIDGSRVIDVNEKLLQTFGYTFEEMISNPATIRYANPEQRKELVKLLQQYGSVSNFEADMVRKDNTLLTALVSVMSYPEEGILEGSFVDITERKQAEEAMKNSEVKLRELNATKDKFFSIVAHDLKSPFNAILGFSGMLKEEARNLDVESILKYTDSIYSSAKQTFRLLENLLDWARMNQGSIPFEPKAVLINGLLKGEIESLKYSADQKNIALVNNVPAEIIINADEKMLTTVIRNLISNAIKFTPKNGSVTVEGRIINDHVEISVSDTGIGMNKEAIEKLFKIETSFTTRGTENEKGSGLGLLLCKEFIESHGGVFLVESEQGKGSKFMFSIPLFNAEKSRVTS